MELDSGRRQRSRVLVANGKVVDHGRLVEKEHRETADDPSLARLGCTLAAAAAAARIGFGRRSRRSLALWLAAGGSATLPALEQLLLHLLQRRITYEEEAFAAKRRGQVTPPDYFAGGQVKRGKSAPTHDNVSGQRLLFSAED